MALLVRRAEGPEIVRVGERATYRVTAFNQSEPSEAAKGKINWQVRCDGADYRTWQKEGEILTFKIAADLAGKTLLVMPYLNSPARSISVISQIRPGAGQILREGLRDLKGDFTDILGNDIPDISDYTLAERLKDLGFAVDDILDSAGPVDPGDDIPDDDAARLAIIVGHTEASKGARALPPIDRTEYPFNTDVAKLMEQAARDRGIAARTFFRDGVGIYGAYRAAVAYEADAIIELHFNSFDNPSVRGTETLYSDANAQSARLAELVQQAVVNVFGRSGRANRGVKMPGPRQRGYTNVTASPSVPSVLVEPFFGSNAADCRLAADKMGDYAQALVHTFAGFNAAQ